MSVLSEERSNVNLINSTTVVSVNRSESSVWGVIIRGLELSLERLKSSLKINFFFNYTGESEFNVSWEVVVSSNVS